MTPAVIDALILLYPARWRARYADEFRVVLEECPATVAIVADVCRGAIDAQLHFEREMRRREAARCARRRHTALVAGAVLLFGAEITRGNSYNRYNPPPRLFP